MYSILIKNCKKEISILQWLKIYCNGTKNRVFMGFNPYVLNATSAKHPKTLKCVYFFIFYYLRKMTFSQGLIFRVFHYSRARCKTRNTRFLNGHKFWTSNVLWFTLYGFVIGTKTTALVNYDGKTTIKTANQTCSVTFWKIYRIRLNNVETRYIVFVFFLTA